MEIMIGAYKSLYVGQKRSPLPEFLRNLDLAQTYAKSLYLAQLVQLNLVISRKEEIYLNTGVL